MQACLLNFVSNRTKDFILSNYGNQILKPHLKKAMFFHVVYYIALRGICLKVLVSTLRGSLP
jgi:hypothetical protein